RRQLSGCLLYALDVEGYPVGRAAWRGVDVNSLEKAEGSQPLAGRLNQQTVERVALCQPELAHDSVVLGAGITDNVDPLDVDARTFVDDVGDIQDVVHLVAI